MGVNLQSCRAEQKIDACVNSIAELFLSASVTWLISSSRAIEYGGSHFPERRRHSDMGVDVMSAKCFPLFFLL